jgi:hypothetical protein
MQLAGRQAHSSTRIVGSGAKALLSEGIFHRDEGHLHAE